MKRQILLPFIIALVFATTGCGTNNAPLTTENNHEPVVSSEVEDTEESGDNTPNNQEPAKEESNQHHAEAEEQKEEASNDEPLQELSVHYIDVGQADATLFEYADEEEAYTILFDTGNWNRNDVVNYLKDQDITSIDLVATSHPHSDHIGQLAEIVQTFEVGEVWMSGNASSSNTYQHAAQVVLDSDTDYHQPRTGEELSIGPMDITVLYPTEVTGDLNEESVSLRMSYGEVDFVFTGDAEKAGEADMVQSGMTLDADILQLGHHGSRTSSTASFINAVNPDVAIYSAAVDSQYGHPDPEVVTRIQDAGIDLYGTDVNGTVVVTTDGRDYDVKTSEEGTISPKSTGSANASTSTPESAQSNATEETTASEAAEGCVDINHATSEELEEIIHIGPARAQDLIDLRPFQSVNDLDRISGIAAARMADIKAQGMACVN